MEHAQELLPYLWTIICGFVAIFGKMILGRLDELTAAVKESNTTMIAIERDLRGGLSNLDRRVSRIEAICDQNYKRGEK